MFLVIRDWLAVALVVTKALEKVEPASSTAAWLGSSADIAESMMNGTYRGEDLSNKPVLMHQRASATCAVNADEASHSLPLNRIKIARSATARQLTGRVRGGSGSVVDPG